MCTYMISSLNPIGSLSLINFELINYEFKVCHEKGKCNQLSYLCVQDQRPALTANVGNAKILLCTNTKRTYKLYGQLFCL